MRCSPLLPGPAPQHVRWRQDNRLGSVNEQLCRDSALHAARRTKEGQRMLTITCHGAVGEIGGNKIMIEDEGHALMLDFGKSFSAQGLYFDEFLQPRTNSCLRDLLALGLLPAIPGIYRHDLLQHAECWSALSGSGLPAEAERLYVSDLESHQDFTAGHGPRLDGILLSHGHADHCQYLAFVDRSIQVYCSVETHAILRAAQEIGKGGHDSDICECPTRTLGVNGDKSTFPGHPKIDKNDTDCARDVIVLEPYKTVSVGAFQVTPVPVDHSVPGAYSYLILTPSGKRVFYTGDLRFHGRYSAAPYGLTESLREFTSGLQPDLLITEGTRISSDKRDSEQDVEDRIAGAVSECSGLAIVDFGWKDVSRFLTILNVAEKSGRTLAVSPKVAYLWELLRSSLPDAYPDLRQAENLRVYLKRLDSMTYSLSDYSAHKYLVGTCADWGPRSTEMKAAFATRDDDYLGSRLCHFNDGVRAYDIAADPSRYILHAGYFDMNELFDVSPPAGSVFVRAATEPFSDDMVSDEKKLENWLSHFGINEGLDEKVLHYHVSGHACGPDLLQFIADMSPAKVIPIHTCEPEIFERELGDRCEVIRPELGTPSRF